MTTPFKYLSYIKQAFNTNMATVNQSSKDFSTENPEHLENMVVYQKDAVVSKTLIKKPTGTVTLFAFDKGQGLSEHTAPFDAMVCLLDGEAEITIAKTSYVVKKGEMIMLPANIPHTLSASLPFKMLLTMIKS